ncbi:SIR2 family NAD-dependent protein deacylase [Rheinheimera sp. MMS21-TC3]|uniref:SIR2 family NAD-dependent protein deacylase n=1 Tax=Rheinheimera sp. MMS21-TC3 TaxID=3072790 RepID=UPI0028C41B04|nr:Sir2 family NAD-dependent protein deacetylase [Rheinheimera sp. MMS21-TC3]WNO61026.1 Sir2 family NAD-dependent protein deacetylase [Rheinheimera sp. MMS21-TC3]
MLNTTTKLEKIVVFSGAGISAASGLPTFRDNDGLWQKYDVYQLATPEGFAANPSLVHQFYQSRRLAAAKAQPNAAHLAIAALEQHYKVVVITQNVDNLHERAGSTDVIHLHGKLNEMRMLAKPDAIFDVGDTEFSQGSHAPDGSIWQPEKWRPNIVWFGEAVPNLMLASEHISAASKVLVVGSSLQVEPAASLLLSAKASAEKHLIDKQPGQAAKANKLSQGFNVQQGDAAMLVPKLVGQWLEAKS